jgi:hypothetical protein
LAAALVVPWWRGKCTPSPLYKGGAQGGEEHTTRATSSPFPSWCALLHLSHLSLSRGLLKGYTRARQHHSCTLSCCGVSGSHLKSSTSTILARSGMSGVVLITIRVQVRGGASTCGTRVVAPSSLTTLRSATSASSTTLVRARKFPRSVSKGMLPKHQLIITILPVDRSLGNSGLRR